MDASGRKETVIIWDIKNKNMSTYYFIKCDDCKQISDVASKVASGSVCDLCDSDVTLLPFMVKHAYHNIEIFNEYDNRLEDSSLNDYIEWNRKNWKEIYKGEII